MKVSVQMEKLKKAPVIGNKIVIGGSGIGRSCVMIKFNVDDDKRITHQFTSFCDYNHYEYNITRHGNKYIISCEKDIFVDYTKKLSVNCQLFKYRRVNKVFKLIIDIISTVKYTIYMISHGKHQIINRKYKK